MWRSQMFLSGMKTGKRMIDLGQGDVQPLRLYKYSRAEGTPLEGAGRVRKDNGRNRRDTDKATRLFDVRLAMTAIATLLLIGSLICLIIALITLCS